MPWPCPRVRRTLMLRARRPSTRVTRIGGAAALAGLASLALAIDSPTSHAAGQSQLQQQISSGQGKVSALQGQVNAVSGRLGQLDSSIGGLEARISRIQADLDAKRAELIRLQLQLNAARKRLAQVRAFETRGEQVLSEQLVNTYESDHPDLVTVVLESHGFQDLLERLTFAQKVQKQNVQIVRRVRAARKLVAAEAVKLGSLEVRQQKITLQVLHERNGLASARLQLVRQRIVVAKDRAAKAGALASAKDQVAGLQSQLSKLQAVEATAASGSGSPTGPTTGTPAGSSR